MKVLFVSFLFCVVCSICNGQCTTTYSNISTSACDTFISPDNQTLSISGTYYDTILNSNGCDSVITIDLTIHQSVAVTIFASTCGYPYVSLAGITYYHTGLFIENHSTINGCDSTVFVNVEIALHTDYGTRVVEGCGQYISDADSIYTQSGFYWEPEIEPTGQGCFSYIPYQVTIIDVDPQVFIVDQVTLKATDQGTSFQWVDCNNNYEPIVGDTNQIFSTNLNGDYACIVSVNNCSDTSACFRIGTVSIEELSRSIELYPNPTTGKVILEIGDRKNVNFSIFDISNKLVYKTDKINSPSYQFELNQPAGMYIIEINSDGESKKFKLIKE